MAVIHGLSTWNFPTAAIVCGAVISYPDSAHPDKDQVSCLRCRDLMERPRRPAEGMSEKELLQQIRTLARECVWRTYHTHTSNHSERGWPDLVLLRPPLLLVVELKRAGEIPTPEQQAWLDGLAQVERVQVDVWRPADWERITDILTAEGKV